MTIFDVKSASAYLKLSPNFLRRLAQSGEVPCKRLGAGKCARYRFTKEAIDAWLADGPEFVDPRRATGRTRKRLGKGGGNGQGIRSEDAETARAGGADCALPAAGQPDHEDAA